MDLFNDVKYYIALSLPQEKRSNIQHVLDSDGGTAAESLDDATHIISNSIRFEGWQEASTDAAIVTTKWVERSIVLRKLQPTEAYSPDSSLIFSGVVGCAAELLPSDLEVISSGITALGGQWRTGLTKDVTHLFVLSDASDKYQTAMEFKSQTQMKVLLPHWFDDAVRLGLGDLDTTPYEWPEPAMLKISQDGDDSSPSKKNKKLDPDKRILFQTAFAEADTSNLVIPPVKDVWGNRRILIGTSLELTKGKREAVEGGIRRGNGAVIRYTTKEGAGSIQEELSKVDECDVFITRYRSGKPYFQAIKGNKMIGTLSWLFHVQATGVLTHPMDQLLHYPVPKKPIEGFTEHEITITNYTGDARDYLKKLIHAMGAIFTPSMSPKNTILIAAYVHGTKTDKASAWSIPIVNHTWLEDCFVKWETLTPAREKYTCFPPGVDFSSLLGTRGVDKDVEKDVEAHDEAEEENSLYRATVPPATATSANDAMDAMEVEEITNPSADNDPPAMTGANGQGKDIDIDEDISVPGLTLPRKGPASKASPLKKAAIDSSPQRPRSGKRKRSHPPGDKDHEDLAPGLNGPTTRSPSTRSRGRLSVEDVDMDGVDDDVHVKKTRGGARSTSRSGTRRKSTSRRDEPDVFSGDETQAKRPRRMSRGKIVQSPPALNAATETDDEVEVLPINASLKTPAGRGKRRASAVSKPTSTRKSLGSSPHMRSIVTPRREVTVVLPHLNLSSKPSTSAAGRGEQRVDSPSQAPASPSVRPMERRESLRAVAAERRTATRPSTSPSKSRNAAASAQALASSSPAKPEEVPGRSKRSAATRATQRLHNEVMPDVMNFEQEKRRASRRSTGGPEALKARRSSELMQEDDSVISKKRKKSAKPQAESGTEQASDDDNAVDTKKRKVVKGKGKQTVLEAGDAASTPESIFPPFKAESSRKPTKAVKLLTTQVSLSDDVLKALSTLGVKTVTRPSDCTHLLAPHIVRTEKFLCALAQGPYVLTKLWALDSASAKKLMPEEKYTLQDKAGEQKFDFSLAESISRARGADGKLLDKHIFYVTPGVQIDRKLLKNVITACGGQMLTQTPTRRLLDANSNRHVISCTEDEHIWAGLSDTYRIYSPELVLNAALKQKVDWDNTDCIVAG